MLVINQPYDAQLGAILQARLASGQFDSLVLAAAFAKRSGVLRMKESFEAFRQGGGKITAFIGIDQDGTSFEALVALFHLCDELYLVHTESTSQTFHPKVYDLSGQHAAWLAVGSNNLTGGGLWTNFEICAIESHATANPGDACGTRNLDELFRRWRDKDTPESIAIHSVDEIEELLTDGYINKEADQAVTRAQAGQPRARRRRFAPSITAQLPPLPREPIEDGVEADQSDTDDVESEEPASIGRSNDLVWFETREMTGGSGNILDLSKTGRVVHGSPRGTVFDNGQTDVMRGGVHFFHVDPADVHVQRDVTVNYSGVDYPDCTVKIHIQGARPNGSWRIQLKGVSASGESLEHAVARTHANGFKKTVLLFEEVGPHYYSLSVVEDSRIDDMLAASVVVARNGAAANSKRYGVIRSFEL